MTPELLSEFLTIVTNCLGRINPRSVTEKYFAKLGKSDLWQQFINTTEHLSKYSYTERLKFLQAGHFNSLPKCYCDNDITLLDRKVSKYCSIKCLLSAPERRTQLSASKKNADHAKIDAKRKATMLEKYGVEYNCQRPEVKVILSQPKLKPEIYNKLTDFEWMYQRYIIEKKSGVQIGREVGCDYGTVLEYCRKYGFEIRQNYSISACEQEICTWLRSLGLDVIQNDRDILGKQELDIVIPSKNIAIEVNGIYFHSEKFRGQKYHQQKTFDALKEGYQLLQFSDFEWYEKQNIVKNIIKSKLGLTETIYARKCIAKELTNRDVRTFLDKNHIQGYISAPHCYGLFFNDELVQIITLGKARFSKVYQYELLRMCSKENITVVGGFSKLMKFANKKNIISYCDLRFSTGKGYEAAGWTKVNITKPGYFWTSGKDQLSRFKTQKRNLKKLFPTCDLSKSETEIMTQNGYVKTWDCGNLVFVW